MTIRRFSMKWRRDACEWQTSMAIGSERMET
jgi:hypothetical protein